MSVTRTEFLLLLFLLLPERVAEGEFIQGVMENEGAIRLIQFEPGK